MLMLELEIFQQFSLLDIRLDISILDIRLDSSTLDNRYCTIDITLEH